METDDLYQQFMSAILKDMIDYILTKYPDKSVHEQMEMYNDWRGRMIKEKITDKVMNEIDLEIMDALNGY